MTRTDYVRYSRGTYSCRWHSMWHTSVWCDRLSAWWCHSEPQRGERISFLLQRHICEKSNLMRYARPYGLDMTRSVSYRTSERCECISFCSNGLLTQINCITHYKGTYSCRWHSIWHGRTALRIIVGHTRPYGLDVTHIYFTT